MILTTIQNNGHLRVKGEDGEPIHIGIFDLNDNFLYVCQPFFERFLTIYNDDIESDKDDSDDT